MHDSSNNLAEESRIRSIDDLVRMEKLKDLYTDQLLDDLANGMSADKMVEKYLPLLKIRQISMGLTEPDTTKALAAIKDLRDRSEGRAIERKEILHHLDELNEKEIDALLLNEFDEFTEE